MSQPQIVTDPTTLRREIAAMKASGRTVGLVPTMGALHVGHLSLVEAARRECGAVITTIFVNPAQFGPGEDFDQYPRDLKQDRQLLAPAGCDLIFAPSVDTMYPAGCEASIDVGSVARPLEGEFRPGHFPGVATVVLKLFHLAPADIAYFGQKDYQQSLVIHRMVEDLNVPVALRTCPTVREPDGLAMSSRNAYLSSQERFRASKIWAGLQTAQQLYDSGEQNAERIRGAVLGSMAQGDIQVDYVAVVRQGTVEPLRELNEPAAVLVAGRVGQTRLIDNLVLQ